MNTKIRGEGQWAEGRGQRGKGQGAWGMESMPSVLCAMRHALCAMRYALCVILITVFTGCQQNTAQVKPDNIIPGQESHAKRESRQMAPQKADEALIDRITFERSDSAINIFVKASGPIRYTTFKLSDPTRLVIDIPDANMDNVKEPIVFEDELINQITTAQYGKEQAGANIGRIIIELKNDVDYKVDLMEGRLLVSLNKTAAPETLQVQTAVKNMPPEQSLQKLVPADSKQGEVMQGAVNIAAANDVKKASAITGIETIKKEKNLTQIIVFADGNIGSYNAFGLDDPSRLVIDIWGVGKGMLDKEVNIGGGHIKKVRIGEHMDKIRLVFESVPKNLPLYSIDVAGSAMTISYGRVEVKKFIPADSKHGTEPQVAAKPLVEENRVSGIDFMPSTDGTKITITTLKKPYYKLSKSLDGKNIVIDLKDVVIPEELKRTADMAALDTPVSSISSFQTSAKGAGKGARILVKLKEGAFYDITQDNNSININFPAQKAQVMQAVKQSAAGKEGGSVIEDPSKNGIQKDGHKTASKLVPADSKQREDKVQLNVKAELPKPVAAYSAEGNKTEVRVEAVAAPEEKKDEKEEGKAVDKILVPADSKQGEVMADAVPASNVQYTGKKISLDFKDADIGNVIRLIAEVSNFNIITTEDVTGKVTLRLIDVPWDQAFDVILKSKGLGKAQEGNVIRVLPLARIKQEDDAVIAAKKAKEKLEDMVSQKIPVNYATATDMGAKLKNVISERGSITVDERTNTIIIKDIPANIKNAVELVKSLDTATPQVLIEARIVEAGNDFARDLGIQWGLDASTVGGKRQLAMFGATGTSGQTGVGGVGGVSNFAVNLPISATGALGFTFGKLTGDPLTLDLKLTAAESAGMTKIISRPRIATLDNKKAVIKQGEQVPYETVSSTGTQTQWADVTLSLEVTPRITPDGSVGMNLVVSNKELGSFRSSSGAPSIKEKSATTEILVKDGETAVIGGIIKNSKSDSVKGVPYLKDIPILGWLFKSQSVADVQSELLIFITPTILKGKEPI